MDNKDWYNHSSVYSLEHSKFYRWVLYPVVILFIIFFFFLFFAKKEVVIRTQAIVTPFKISKVQATMDVSIKENYLVENSFVEKGTLLLRFNVDELLQKKKQLEIEINTGEKKSKSLSDTISALEKEQILTKLEIDFGQSNEINAFLKEKEAVLQTILKIEETYNKNQTAFDQEQAQLEIVLENSKKEKEEWIQVRKAWVNNQQNITGFSNNIMTKYQMWQNQVHQAIDSQKAHEIVSILSNIDDLLNQIEQNITQQKVNYDKMIAPVSVISEITEQKAKLAQNKELIIKKVKEAQFEIDATNEKNLSDLNIIKDNLKNSEVYSKIDGTIHVNDEYEHLTEIAKGSVLAEIYSTVEQSRCGFTTEIPSSEMMSVKKGMKVSFSLDKKGVAERTIKGHLTKISETSEGKESGNFYKVWGILEATPDEIPRYGLTGQLSLILGKKTYLKQIIDIIFNNSN